MLGGRILQPIDDAVTVLRRYRDFVTGAPGEVNCLVWRGSASGESSQHVIEPGTPIIQLLAVYAADPEDGEVAIHPIRAFGDPIADEVGLRPYTDLHRLLTETAASGYRNYWKSDYLVGLPGEAIDVVVDNCDPFPSDRSSVFFETMGGDQPSRDRLDGVPPPRSGRLRHSLGSVDHSHGGRRPPGVGTGILGRNGSLHN